MTEGLLLYFYNRLEPTLQSVYRLTAPLAQGSLLKLSPFVNIGFILLFLTQTPLPPQLRATYPRLRGLARRRRRIGRGKHRCAN